MARLSGIPSNRICLSTASLQASPDFYQKKIHRNLGRDTDSQAETLHASLHNTSHRSLYFQHLWCKTSSTSAAMNWALGATHLDSTFWCCRFQNLLRQPTETHKWHISFSHIFRSYNNHNYITIMFSEVITLDNLCAGNSVLLLPIHIINVLLM